MTARTIFRVSHLIPLLVIVLFPGCGGRYSVTGRVTYEDGTPVDGGTVIGETTVNGKAVGVQGNIEKDGSFTWGTDKAGDGAVPGTYRVIVMPVALSDFERSEGKRPAVPSKYGKYETSGITFEVKPGKNELKITVTKPKGKAEDE